MYSPPVTSTAIERLRTRLSGSLERPRIASDERAEAPDFALRHST
jgi:hypothetical protein